MVPLISEPMTLGASELNLVSVSQIPYFFSSSTASHADSV